jgi:hypothetical protein
MMNLQSSIIIHVCNIGLWFHALGEPPDVDGFPNPGPDGDVSMIQTQLGNLQNLALGPIDVHRFYKSCSMIRIHLKSFVPQL